MKGEQVAEAQGIPIKFLENILVDLRQAGIVNSRRGPDGGYWLARPAAEVSVADVMRAAEGPLASVRGEKPEDLGYDGAAEALRDVWVALRAEPARRARARDPRGHRRGQAAEGGHGRGRAIRGPGSGASPRRQPAAGSASKLRAASLRRNTIWPFASSSSSARGRAWSAPRSARRPRA